MSNNKKGITSLLSMHQEDTLKMAVELMAKENVDVLPVISPTEKNTIIGVLTYQNIIASYKHGISEHEEKSPSISFKRKGLKIIRYEQK